MFTTRRYDDPGEFQRDVEKCLLRDEPRHNLILGLLRTLIEQPDLRPTPGAARVAGPDDLELVRGLWKAFRDEAGPDEPWDEEQMRQRLRNRLAGLSGERAWLWEDGGGPVSLAGCAGATQNGIRIGPVYTPPELRGRGYATGLVAHASQELLASGRAFCFLYTDMSNPTSNAIYRRIGYRLHCGSAMVRFE